MRVAGALACLAVAFGALIGAACGDDEKSPAPPPVAPPPPPSVAPPPPPSSGERVPSIQVTTILVAYRSRKLPDARSKREALEIARSVIAKGLAGESWDDLVRVHTDDRAEDGQPFNRGSYSLDPRDSRTQSGLIQAAKATPVGEIAPEPYDSGLGYVLLRRDR